MRVGISLHKGLASQFNVAKIPKSLSNNNARVTTWWYAMKCITFRVLLYSLWSLNFIDNISLSQLDVDIAGILQLHTSSFDIWLLASSWCHPSSLHLNCGQLVCRDWAIYSKKFKNMTFYHLTFFEFTFTEIQG